MPKFYVSSSRFRQILEAADPEGAALTALHRALSDADFSVGPADEGERVAVPAVDLWTWIDESRIERIFGDWGTTVDVSEQGFDRHEAGRFDRDQLVITYCQLVLAIETMRCDRGINAT